MEKYFLNNDWKFTCPKIPEQFQKKIKQGDWIAANVPGTVHTDLLNAGLIDDPFYSNNEIRLQWIGETDWLYKLEFNLPDKIKTDKPIELVFEGLDTVSQIRLNGTEIGFTDNMFRSYYFNVAELIKSRTNILEVLFLSPKNYACELEKINGKLPVSLNSERVYLRKAQYSFGWDWGPSFVTMGIWKPVYLLKRYEDIAIKNVFFYTVNIKDNTAHAKVKIDFSNNSNEEYYIKVKLTNSYQEIEKYTSLHQKKSVDLNLKISDPKLWYPNGYGQPVLYKMVVQVISDDNKIIDTVERRVGIRSIKLNLKEDEKPTFKFIVNGIPVFVKGANWIPSDSFLPRVTNEKYRSLLLKAKESNMNMIRVWGGGIYEQDIFYELCDELGLMVWQDFMFACAAYSEQKEFLKNVANEVKENVTRLQYHPSIAIWCGNNENEWIWYNEQKKPYREMPGYLIFHDLIPKILEKLDIGRPYWESTPFSNEEDPNSVNSGNRHQWELWSKWVDYKKVIDDNSLFVTEFGFQSPANYDTFIKVLPKNERYPQSRIFEFHNKQVEGPERVLKFLASHLPVKLQFQDYIYLSQLNHGLALKECIEHWRKRFPKTNGTIIWQLNDCWPVTSWALIDSDLKPKLPYYFVKEVFKPNIFVFDKVENKINGILINNSRNEFSGIIQIHRVNLIKSKISIIDEKEVHLSNNEKLCHFSIDISEEIITGKEILVSSVYNNAEVLIHRNHHLGTEWKYVKCNPSGINIKEINDKDKKIVINSNSTGFFVNLYHPKAIFDQNGFIILPGEAFILNYGMLSGRLDKEKITANCLNNYLIKSDVR